MLTFYGGRLYTMDNYFKHQFNNKLKKHFMVSKSRQIEKHTANNW